MRAWIAALAALFVLAGRTAGAQVYPGAAPVPRTTDPAAMSDLARNRGIKERIGMAFSAELRGDYTAAKSILIQVLALTPDDAPAATALYDLGIAQANLHELDEAAASFEGAVAHDPGFLAARANLVAVQLARNDLPAARRAADAFIARAPAAARALYGRGLAALRQNDAATAEHDFSALVQRNPRYAVARYDLALAEIAQNRLEEAQNELQTALAVAPSYARARFALATVYLRTGHKAEAREQLQLAARDASDPSLRTLALSLRDTIAP